MRRHRRATSRPRRLTPRRRRQGSSSARHYEDRAVPIALAHEIPSEPKRKSSVRRVRDLASGRRRGSGGTFGARVSRKGAAPPPVGCGPCRRRLRNGSPSAGRELTPLRARAEASGGRGPSLCRARGGRSWLAWSSGPSSNASTSSGPLDQGVGAADGVESQQGAGGAAGDGAAEPSAGAGGVSTLDPFKASSNATGCTSCRRRWRSSSASQLRMRSRITGGSC
jgi:hypothetical protein